MHVFQLSERLNLQSSSDLKLAKSHCQIDLSHRVVLHSGTKQTLLRSHPDDCKNSRQAEELAELAPNSTIRELCCAQDYEGKVSRLWAGSKAQYQRVQIVGLTPLRRELDIEILVQAEFLFREVRLSGSAKTMSRFGSETNSDARQVPYVLNLPLPHWPHRHAPTNGCGVYSFFLVASLSVSRQGIELASRLPFRKVTKRAT